MRICRVTKYLPGNAEHPGVQHAYFLTKYIEEPTLIIVKKDRREGYPVPAHATVKEIEYRDVAFSQRLPGGAGVATLPEWRVGLGLLQGLGGKVREAMFLLKSIPSLVRFRPDVVHVHGLMPVCHGVFAKALLRSRFVVTLHGGADVTVIERVPGVRRLLGYADRVVCVSSEIRDRLAKWMGKGQLVWIPSAVDLETFLDRGLPRKRQLVAVGYFKWQKGYRYLIEAMVEVLRRFEEHRLVIVGDGPDRDALTRQIAELGLGGRVELAGAVSQSEVARYLNESQLFVMASVVEGLPKALLEALACGTPAVVTSACNAEAFIDRVGTMVTPGDSKALASAIIALLGDDARQQRLAQAGPAVAQERGWSTVAERVAQLYGELGHVASGRAPRRDGSSQGKVHGRKGAVLTVEARGKVEQG